jgi:hypothetical protein
LNKYEISKELKAKLMMKKRKDTMRNLALGDDSPISPECVSL